MTTEPTNQSQMIFINLPVSDLKASIAFYETVLGAVADTNFRDDSAQMMRISDIIHVMLLTHERFSSFTPRKIPNAHETAQVLICVSETSRDAVDSVVDKGLAAGGTEPNPKQDHGFMYGRNFADLDGHIWEVMWMDVAAAMQAHESEPA